MATKILQVSKTQKGTVAEFGSYKGSSTTNLSIICDIVGRKLEVFDSFAGLPKPSRDDQNHHVLNLGEIHSYQKGAYQANLNLVKKNISKYGSLSVCNFHPGFFNKTLPEFHNPVVFAFIDVDLAESLKDVLIYLWPLLKDNSYVFIHEAHHQEIASLFFDKDWWQKKLKTKPPGLIGAGNGLGLFPQSSGYTSPLGYIVKKPDFKKFKIEKQSGV